MGHKAGKEQHNAEIVSSTSQEGGEKGSGKGKGRREVETVGRGGCMPSRTSKPSKEAPEPFPGDTPAQPESIGMQPVDWGSGWTASSAQTASSVQTASTTHSSSPSKQAPPPPPSEPGPWSRPEGNRTDGTSHASSQRAPIHDYEMNANHPSAHDQDMRWWAEHHMMQHWGGVPKGLQAPPILPAPSLGLPSLPISQAQREAEAELQRKNVQIMAVTQQIQAAQAELQQLRSQQQAADENARSQAARGVAAARIQQARELVAGTKPEVESMKENLMKSLMVAKKLDAWFRDNAQQMNIQDPNSTPSAFVDKLLTSCDRRLEVLSNGIAKTMGGGVGSGTMAIVANASNPQVTVNPYVSAHGQSAQIGSQPVVQQAHGQGAHGQDAQLGSQPVVQSSHSVAQVGSQPLVQHTHVQGAHGQGAQVGSQLVVQSAHGQTTQPVVQPYGGTMGFQPQLQQHQQQVQPQPMGSQVGPSLEASKPGGVGVAGMWVQDPDEA